MYKDINSNIYEDPCVYVPRPDPREHNVVEAIKSENDNKKNLPNPLDPDELLDDIIKEYVAGKDGVPVQGAPLDCTLSQSGMAADAKAVGDAIKALQKGEVVDPIGKVSGPAVFIQDAMAGKPISLKVYGRAIQDGTPTVDTPIVPTSSTNEGGDSQFRQLGKNLINVGETTLTAGGTYDKTIGANVANGVVPGHTYTLSMVLTKANVKTGTVVARVYDKKGGTIASVGQSVPGDGKLSLTFTVPDIGIKNIYILMSNRTNGDTITLTDVQLEHGDAVTAYEAYIAHKAFTATGLAGNFWGIPVESSGNYTDENGQQYICDVLDYTNGVIERNCGYIASYAGETIPGAYMSSTGELTTGATVVYALAEPTTSALPASSIAEYANFAMYSPNTTITHMSGAWIEVEYNRLLDIEENKPTNVQMAFDPHPLRYDNPVAVW